MPLSGSSGVTNVSITVLSTDETREGYVLFTDGTNSQTLEIREYNKYTDIPLTFDVISSGTIV